MQRARLKSPKSLRCGWVGSHRPVSWLAVLSIGLAAWLAGLADPGSALAQTDATQPSSTDSTSATFTSFFTFGRKQVPLPAGTWELVGRRLAAVDELSGTGYGAIESAVLFQTSGDAVGAFIIVRRNVIPIEGGWGISTDCTREDL